MYAFATAVYVLSFLTSAVCGWLLVRSYLTNRTKLLLWCAACFVLLAINNFFVVTDMLLIPDIDFTYVRSLMALSAVSTLLYGFIWELD
ncbi:DUF5985 family protein [Xanthobacteraceae bacterium Astr-EGSB]|uniref:DUF5985 family protein n=1 Tax=Astrobacterium formosum TaxID=3069710 RepID=UPI0027B416A5|nr:DUF5985 family protein [Xanthobacteraceae bacterium Astr-EGSB]